MHKNILIRIGETIDQYRAERRAASAEEEAAPQARLGRARRFLRWLAPNGGTLLLVAMLILTQNVWARRAAAPTTASVTTIPYQGRLADINGDPVTGQVNMEFRLYDVPTGGTPLWEEYWTGGNSVSVSDGLFSVMLGSINPTLADVVQGHDELYLGITVGTDGEMEPRVQLGSVPFSIWSMTVADDSITADKIAAGAVGSEEIATGAVGSEEIADGAVGAAEIATNAVGSDEIAANAVGSDEIATGAVGADELAAGAIGNFVAVDSGYISNNEQIPLPYYSDGSQATISQCEWLVTPKHWGYSSPNCTDDHGFRNEDISIDETGTVTGKRGVMIWNNCNMSDKSFSEFSYLVVCTR